MALHRAAMLRGAVRRERRRAAAFWRRSPARASLESATTPVAAARASNAGGDPYAWLERVSRADVRAQIGAENKYADAVLRGTLALQTQLVKEMLDRAAAMQEDDVSVPEAWGPYRYFARRPDPEGFHVFYRCALGDAECANPEVVLDQNTLTSAGSWVALGVHRLSPDHARVAFTLDETGGAAAVYVCLFSCVCAWAVCPPVTTVLCVCLWRCVCATAAAQLRTTRGSCTRSRGRGACTTRARSLGAS